MALPAALGLALITMAGSAAGAEVSATLEAATERTFSRPHDVTPGPDGRYLYVADVGNGAVKVLDAESLETVGRIGEGDLSSPHDVAFDADGRLLVADTGHDRIAVYTVDGTGGAFAGQITGGLASTEGVTTLDGRIYATSASRHTVSVFAGGAREASVGRYGDGPEAYKRPHDILAGPDGRVYVVDAGNNRIQVLDARLERVASLGGERFAFNEPKYLAFDERGWLYVADEYNNRIRIFDARRREIGTIVEGRRHAQTLRLNRPEGVAVRGGTVWVADTYNHRILRFRLQGLPR